MDWGNVAQVVGPPIAASAIIAGAWQFWAHIKASRAVSALQVHKEYLKLCLDRAEFSSTEQYLRSHPGERIAVLSGERTLPAAQYVWFLSFMLNSLEQTLEHVSDRGEWREVARSQVGYHDRAIAEVWERQKWDKMYGPPLIGVVEEVLGWEPQPLPPGLVRRGRASAEANSLRERLRRKGPVQTLGWRDRIRIPSGNAIGALLAGMAGGAILAWGMIRNSTSSQQAQVVVQPLRTPFPPPPVPQPGPPFDLGFNVGQVLLLLVALGAVVAVGRWLFRKRSALLPAMLPAASTVASTVKADDFIRLSDDLHNLLTVLLLGLAVLTAVAVALGRVKHLPLRIGLLLVLTAVPAVPFFFPALRTMFVQSLFTGGWVEAIYIAMLGAIAGLGFLWSVFKGIRKPAQ